ADKVERQHLDTLYANEQLSPQQVCEVAETVWTPRC
ncbi:phosphonate ABC transporter ATP-binding protein, partial [Pseudomonas syringae pv. actinidiae]|nr:phosphonate ABC transporter ATP-binding protein [Pseudomonas syringae pv. actinidiae]